jgi:hypothetical protein
MAKNVGYAVAMASITLRSINKKVPLFWQKNLGIPKVIDLFNNYAAMLTQILL